MKFTKFKIVAERADGSYAKLTIHEHDGYGARPEVGTTHDEAFNAETDLYNRLVRKFQGEDSE